MTRWSLQDPPLYSMSLFKCIHVDIVKAQLKLSALPALKACFFLCEATVHLHGNAAPIET